MFITDADLTGLLGALLGKPAPTFPGQATWWASIITAANIRAYWTIVEAWMAKGWTKEVIDTWDRGAEFQRSLGLYFCLTDHAQGVPADVEAFIEMAKGLVTDRREELVGLQIFMANGLNIEPTTNKGQVVTGRISGWPDDCWDWGHARF